ncbi:MAG: hypothetical protein LBP87_09055 [Planctomycetaceae bacterium]|jgi:GTPase SAR1 family protein|nr:hypothetical protein [Planctomycetaceae bacterium]
MSTTSKTSPQIAIVGTEGSGKTVLATVWAKRMTQRKDKIFLDPKGFNTGMYVEKVWATLNRGEWNESTAPGTKFELEWNLQIADNAYPVKLIDVAGQDLRNLFAFERHKNRNGLYEIESVILNYLVNSSLVVFVVNLQDFVGEPDEMKRKENEFTLKEIIDKFTANENQQDIIIVFTAYDLYEAEIKKHGNLEQYIKEEFIYLFHAVENWAKKFHKNDDVRQLLLPVAAIAETEIITDDNGTVRRVPKQNFRSFGIDKFSDWIIEGITKNAEQEAERQKWEEIRKMVQEVEQQKQEEEKRKTEQHKETMKNADVPALPLIGVMIISTLLIGIVGCGFGGIFDVAFGWDVGVIFGGIFGVIVGMITGISVWVSVKKMANHKK